MTIKELVEAEIEQLEEDQLDELYQLIRTLVQSKKPAAKPSLMSKLQQVKIDAPADFAANFDFYASGEKHVQ